MFELASGVQVEVETEYLEDGVPADTQKFAFTYKIAIRNTLAQDIQLMSRYWLITDGNGKRVEVQGPGVVGKQPVISPGRCYRYVSGAVLDTPVGTMEGYYEMVDEQGQSFQVPIKVFSLAVPHLVN